MAPDIRYGEIVLTIIYRTVPGYGVPRFRLRCLALASPLVISLLSRGDFFKSPPHRARVVPWPLKLTGQFE